jgi:hypothetical protein
MQEQFSLIVAGGGARCAHSTAVMHTLNRAFSNFSFNSHIKHLIAASGSTAPAAFYLCEPESYPGYRAWEELLVNPKFVNTHVAHLLFWVFRKRKTSHEDSLPF